MQQLLACWIVDGLIVDAITLQLLLECVARVREARMRIDRCPGITHMSPRSRLHIYASIVFSSKTVAIQHIF